MKKMVFAAVAAMGVVVSAGAKEILENGAFEQVENGKARGWALGGCFKVLPGEGHNGNMGLVWAATNRQGRLHAASQTLKGVKPGDLVKMSALVKREGFRTDADQGAGDPQPAHRGDQGPSRVPGLVHRRLARAARRAASARDEAVI